MSRFAVTQAAPQQRALRETEDGDSEFIAMDAYTPKEYLQAGYYPLAINKRMADGRAATRPGTVTPVFANLVPYGTILGSGIYSNPNGDVALLVATPTQVIAVTDLTYPSIIPIPAGTTLSGPCTFDDNFDKCYLNSANLTLVWDGISPDGFVPNTRQSPDNSLYDITPNVEWSQNVADRRVFPLSRNSIGVTPILDYTEYATNPLNQAPNIGSFRVNTGTSDYLVGAYLYGTDGLIIGKRKSIDIIAGFSGDLSTASMQTLSTEVGIAARKAVKMVGADMIFPFDTGVYRIQQVIQDRIVASAQPVGTYQNQFGAVVDPFAPIMKRINWSYSSGMTAAVLSPYYFLAVPLDGSKVNNAVLIYNTVKDRWEGYDQWSDSNGNSRIQIDDLWVMPYQGVNKVYAVDTNAQSVYVLYEGKTDILATGEYQIADLLETRGYSNLSPVNQFKKVEIGIATWMPSISVSQRTDKVGDTRMMTSTPITKNPTMYNVFGKQPYTLDNSNSDFYSPGRQDYSIPDGVYYDNGGGGINIEEAQQSVLSFSTMARARYLSYLIQNTQGFCAIDGVIMRVSATPRQQLGTA